MSLLHKIAFSSLRGMTPRLAEALLARIGDEEHFFSADEQQLSAMAGCRNKLFDTQYRKDILEKAGRELDFIRQNSIKPVYITDKDFPARLADCDDAPVMLYTLGDCNLNASKIISIVGTRHATPYGLDFVMNLVDTLAEKLDNIVIVSGLAYGIDIAAHRAAIHAGVPTIAVLAHGLNTIYPAVHRSTAVEIARQGGMLISDYTSQDPLHKGNFVARNRIVAGLCDCLVVAESAEKGGALITAGIASGYNRDVMALPGRTSDKFSQGCNKLISDNMAALISSGDDLIRLMGWTAREAEGNQQELPLELTPDETKITEYLRNHGEGSLNRMCVDLDIPVYRLTPMLVDMEFKGLVLPYPGGKYRPA
ncbi:MAG TPA: DNA-processing protein DprA [Muribaculum sp.]|jgi:DNA processing protein|uniref:DNA-processing protein DprA n=1 Tax=Heminiphilus faecis TaxID=2601703 RepID=A0ABV4CT65_9BACT|nr:DNA-processing protein DprA [Heminiphilus faecis]RLT76673.1 DNA-protecting protein DprA [bacterium J10(2018)]HRF67589.1 DNA-processing protein DprA [Muribaculum sp.]